MRSLLRKLPLLTAIFPAKSDAGQARGAQAEARARAYLEAHGVRILAANARCRFGEIDLIGLDGETLVFVEVRLRSRADYGGAAASITAAKQRHILRTAHWWRQRAPLAHRRRTCRFDAVLLDDADNPRIEWLRSAFAERG